jgi:hypothetical protein
VESRQRHLALTLDTQLQWAADHQSLYFIAPVQGGGT